MKKKKLFIGASTLLVALLIVGCGNSATKKESSSSSNSIESSSVSSSESENKEESIRYTAVVKEDSSSASGQVFIEKLTPIDEKNETPAMFKDQVVLLTDGSNVFNEKTKEVISLDEIKAGMTIEVRLAVEPISTMSIPPQVPGKDVYEILVK